SEPVALDLGALHATTYANIAAAPQQKTIKSVIVVASASGASEMKTNDRWLRLVRMTLLRKGVNVIVGDVRARIEELAGGRLQSRKERLEEAEKLVVLGEKTGADAFLVFDSLKLMQTERDIRLDGRELRIQSRLSTRQPKCPRGFRLRAPVLALKGKLVNASGATTLAEFDFVEPIYKREQGLQVTVKLQQVDFVPVHKVDTYSPDGCESTNIRYIAEWQREEILCRELRKRLELLLPQEDEIRPDQLDEKVQGLVTQIVDRLFTGAATSRPSSAVP
ncbi:MAG: hypothetical protein ACOY3Y_02070, partial [Acidobacteriota bacterium]